MEQREGLVVLNEKRTGIIVTGLLLFIAIVIILGSVSSVRSDVTFPDTAYFRQGTNIPASAPQDNSDPGYWLADKPETWPTIAYISKQTPDKQKEFYKFLIEKSAWPSFRPYFNQMDTASIKTLWNTLNSNEVSIIVGGKPISDKLNYFYKELATGNGKPEYGIKLWDSLDWKNDFSLYTSLDEKYKITLLESLKNGIPGEKRDTKLPRHLEFLQVTLTGTNSLGDPLSKDNSDALKNFNVKDLVSSYFYRLDSNNVNDIYSLSDLEKVFDKISSKEFQDKKVDANAAFRNFWNNINLDGNRERLLEDFFKQENNLGKKYIGNFFNAMNEKDKGNPKEANLIAMTYMKLVSATKGRYGDGTLRDKSGASPTKIEITEIKGLESVSKMENGKFILVGGKNVDPVEVPVYTSTMTFSEKGASYTLKDGSVLEDFDNTNVFSIDHYGRVMIKDGDKKNLLGFSMFEGVGGKGSITTLTNGKINLVNPDVVDGFIKNSDGTTGNWKTYFLGTNDNYFIVENGKQDGTMKFDDTGKIISTKGLGMMIDPKVSDGMKKYYDAADNQKFFKSEATYAGSGDLSTQLANIDKTSNENLGQATAQIAAAKPAMYFTPIKDSKTGEMNVGGISVKAEPLTITNKNDGTSTTIQELSTTVTDGNGIHASAYPGTQVKDINFVNSQDCVYQGPIALSGGSTNLKIDGKDVWTTTTEGASCDGGSCGGIRNSIQINPELAASFNMWASTGGNGEAISGQYIATINAPVKNVVSEAQQQGSTLTNVVIDASNPIEKSTPTAPKKDPSASSTTVTATSPPLSTPTDTPRTSGSRGMNSVTSTPGTGDVALDTSGGIPIPSLNLGRTSPGTGCILGTSGCEGGKCGPKGCGETSGNQKTSLKISTFDTTKVNNKYSSLFGSSGSPVTGVEVYGNPSNLQSASGQIQFQFSTSWCTPCQSQKQARISESSQNPQLSLRQNPSRTYVYVDVEKNPALAKKLGYTGGSIPEFRNY